MVRLYYLGDITERDNIKRKIFLAGNCKSLSVHEMIWEHTGAQCVWNLVNHGVDGMEVGARHLSGIGEGDWGQSRQRRELAQPFFGGITVKRI